MSKVARIVGKTFMRLSASMPTIQIGTYRNQTGTIENPYQQEMTKTTVGKIITSLEDRWALVGMTGCGKTTMARELLKHLRRAYPGTRTYILDTKQAGDFDSLDGYRIQSQEAPDVLRTPGAIQIWQPPDDRIEDFDLWFKRILQHRKPAIVKVDELSSIINGRDYPEHYKKLNKLGRAFGISLISLSQEGAYIPRQTLGQTTHIVRFRLLDGYDVKKLDKLVGRAKEEQGKDLPDAYGFIYRRIDKADPGFYYSSYKDFFGEH